MTKEQRKLAVVFWSNTNTRNEIWVTEDEFTDLEWSNDVSNIYYKEVK